MRATCQLASFVDLIFLHARIRPERPAIVLGDRVVTYDMMAQGVLRVEDRLRAVGLAPGDLVGIAVDSPVRHMIVAAALYRLGHPSLSVRQIADVLPLDLPIRAFLHGPNEQIHIGQRQIFVDDEWFAGERRPLPVASSTGFSDDRAICRIELSSGTTGRRKAVSHSVDSLHKWVVNYFAALGLAAWERLLSLPGLNSSWGFTLAAHALFAGKTLAFAPSARSSLDMISVYGIDAMVASTQQLGELVREQIKAPVPCSSLRVVLTGGSLLPRSLMLDAGARLCSMIVNQYGSTEAGATAIATIDRLTAIEGATGFVAPWAEIEIVDESDNRLPPGVDGILRIRSNCQAEPFPPGRPDGHAGFRDGWFYPGDRGHLAAEGLLVLSGRTTDIINVGGQKIAPEVIEEALRQHPAVVEAVAIGTRAANGTEEIVVVMVSRGRVTGQAIIEWCAKREIPVARVTEVDALPKTESGKIHRHLVRKQYGGQ
jgi:acyl-coenzyme A synthetase/AMP-(fatty) acid ligase